ncbi:MAG: TetR/AcrR family transcriptional regulator [Huintestinicola sp.]
MDRKEEIILAALELAAEKGLGGITMSRIADRLGIKKPSLYNHFGSKDDIIGAMYEYLREKSAKKLASKQLDYGELVKGKTAKEALLCAVSNYMKMCGDEKMLTFYRVIYSERAVNPVAAKIMTEETRRMILTTKNLFYALQVHKKINVENIDTAAVSFAMTVHAMMEYRLDCLCAGEPEPCDMITEHITWFCRELGGENDEKDSD